ncbi:MAG: phosphorylase [Gomphosphaeria aponina SAG 52.96 = DSM 107014]|uniref:Phosphorylase n=1 Tax=Gomphosphaeria aponina SAG 52.96 = DSM 107014 TaxID=1521640 RepID=A0A941GRC2_9CHRO|nr:phosphorylase [Gomphosphaeria aponina SAG 52.96 = DSM 107014]
MLESGTLWEKVKQTSENALKCGALQPIQTECEELEQAGIKFQVRILSSIKKKEEANKKQEQEIKKGKDFNPFLPYEQDLFVADLSATHVCLLNKYKVVDNHILMITREFEEQESWLTLPDFAAMQLTLGEIDGLAFYNGGKIAGASQRHKHFQLIPLPSVKNSPRIPIEPLLTKIDGIGTVEGLPFINAIAPLTPTTPPNKVLEIYYQLLKTVGLEVNENNNPGAYNLLATREWMLIVPRSQESFESISVNSLGFAGALLVRNPEEMELLKKIGPLTLLKKVGVSVE